MLYLIFSVYMEYVDTWRSCKITDWFFRSAPLSRSENDSNSTLINGTTDVGRRPKVRKKGEGYFAAREFVESRPPSVTV